MRKAIVVGLLVVPVGLCALRAADGSAVPAIPDESSPFFVLREGESRADEKPVEANRQYPANKGSDDSSGRMLARFFTEMFASVRLGENASPTKTTLLIEPAEFSLDERRELTVTFTVANQSNRILKLEFPTGQRIEILVRDPAGKIIERWSDDRAFEQRAGVVMINPDERIEYSERIPTRDMQPGVSYEVEALLANNPEFSRSARVTPKPGPKPAKPAPIPGER